MSKRVLKSLLCLSIFATVSTQALKYVHAGGEVTGSGWLLYSRLASNKLNELVLDSAPLGVIKKEFDIEEKRILFREEKRTFSPIKDLCVENGYLRTIFLKSDCVAWSVDFRDKRDNEWTESYTSLVAASRAEEEKDAILHSLKCTEYNKEVKFMPMQGISPRFRVRVYIKPSFTDTIRKDLEPKSRKLELGDVYFEYMKCSDIRKANSVTRVSEQLEVIAK